MSSLPRRRAVFLKAAKDDVGRLAEDDPSLARQALLKIRELEMGRAEGLPLEAMAKSGDLGDCLKLHFGPGKPPSHRIVYRHIVDGNETALIEIVEVFVLEARAEMYAYLLAALRLGRLPQETKPELNRVHQRVVNARAERRKRSKPAK